MTALLAMLYLALIASLAVGFYASTNSAAMVTENEKRGNMSLVSSESGMDFMRYQLFQVSIAPTTADNAMLSEVQKDLAAQLRAALAQ